MKFRLVRFYVYCNEAVLLQDLDMRRNSRHNMLTCICNIWTSVAY